MCANRNSRRTQRGVSLVEIMVGMVVALLIGLAATGSAVSINLATSAGSCSSDMRCPGLRVDVGGAVRLCGNQLLSDC